MMNFSGMHLLRGWGSKPVIASVQYICATRNHNAAPADGHPSLSVHTCLSMRGSPSVWMWCSVLEYAL